MAAKCTSERMTERSTRSGSMMSGGQRLGSDQVSQQCRPCPRLQSSLLGTRDAQFRHPGLECGGFHSEPLGRAADTADPPIRDLKRCPDVLDLKIPQRRCRLRLAYEQRLRQGNCELRPPRQDDGAFDHVSQFTDVAGPVIQLQLTE